MKVIPIQQAATAIVTPDTAPIPAPGEPLFDRRGRSVRDLRISVTDRCNFRCSYCMPKEIFDRDYVFLPQTSLLSFEEITRLARIFVAHGVQKIRLTGGEPLLRKNLEILIEQLAALRTLEGVQWLELSWLAEAPRLLAIPPPPRLSSTASASAKALASGRIIRWLARTPCSPTTPN